MSGVLELLKPRAGVNSQPNFERHYRYPFFMSRVVPVLQERFNLVRLYYIFYNREIKHMFSISSSTIAEVLPILQQLSQGAGMGQAGLFTDVLVFGRFRVYEENARALTLLLQDQMRLEAMEAHVEGEDEDPATVLHEAFGQMNMVAEDPQANNTSYNSDPMDGGRRRRAIRRRKTRRQVRKNVKRRKATRRQ